MTSAIPWHVGLVEELDIESRLVPARRGQLYTKAAGAIAELFEGLDRALELMSVAEHDQDAAWYAESARLQALFDKWKYDVRGPEDASDHSSL